MLKTLLSVSIYFEAMDRKRQARSGKKSEVNTNEGENPLEIPRHGLSSRKYCFIRVSHKCHFESTMRGKKYTALTYRPSSELNGSRNGAASRLYSTKVKCFGGKMQTSWIIYDSLGFESDIKSDDVRTVSARLLLGSTNQNLKLKSEHLNSPSLWLIVWKIK